MIEFVIVAGLIGFGLGFTVCTEVWERAIRRREMDPNYFRYHIFIEQEANDEFPCQRPQPSAWRLSEHRSSRHCRRRR